MGSQEGMGMVNLKTTEWGRNWDHDPMMDTQVGVLRDIHWKSHLVHNLKLREAPLVRYQVNNLRVLHGKNILV